jgi:F-type H+-transporting ATPase subunit epsilon
MKAFLMKLQDATHSEAIADVTAFTGEDRSGSFSLLAGHARFVTVLTVGLARFRTGTDDWQYLALPAAVLYFRDNQLTLSTRHYLIDSDYRRISAALQQQLISEEEQLHAMKESLHRLEDEFLKRMWEVSRRSGSLPR